MRLNVKSVAYASLVSVIVIGLVLLGIGTPPPELQGDETRVIRISVMSPTNSSHSQYVFLAELAREEINDHCENAGLDY